MPAVIALRIDPDAITPRTTLSAFARARMSGREEIRVPELAEPISHYTDAVRAGDLLFVSGCVPVDGEGGSSAGDVVAQARQVFANIGAVLAAAGASFADVVKVTVFLIDVDDRARSIPCGRRSSARHGLRARSSRSARSRSRARGSRSRQSRSSRDRRVQRAHHRGRAGAGAPRPAAWPRLLVKDLIDTAGIRTTYGSKIYADHVPTRTATAVEAPGRRRGRVVGKANLHEFAWGVTSQNPWYGTVQNPRSPGAYDRRLVRRQRGRARRGLCDLGVGTDTGCSIRLPAVVLRRRRAEAAWGGSDRRRLPALPQLRHCRADGDDGRRRGDHVVRARRRADPRPRLAG